VVKYAFWLWYAGLATSLLVSPAGAQTPPAGPPDVASEPVVPPAAAPVETSTAEDAPEAATPPEPEADRSEGQPLAATGYLLPQGVVELGIFFMGVGVTDWLTVGLMPAPWVIAPIIGGVSINLSVKGGLPIGRFVNLALEINPMWVNVETDDTSTEGWVVPINLAASVHPAERQNYSLAARYLGVSGVNASSIDEQEIAGTVLTQAVQLIAQAQYQLTGAMAIYVQGSLQVWEQQMQVEGEDQLDDQTTVEIEGEASSTDNSRPWNAALGAHFHWSSVNLRVGVGYGNFFVPRIGLTARLYQGVVPDFDFYVRF
jgi:hypothetical protein